MKSKQTKREEALARLQANIARCQEEITEAKHKAKTWVRPVATSKSTPLEKIFIASLSKENPFLSVVEAHERRLARLERERAKLRNVIADNRTQYP